ncbi:MaoC/PaaZ C-terminal domain-containing protein [Shewanella sp. NIFS-20-20]|uniref:MaoC family dehydratase n=1 Tax=Shewanella sp. NIFS-20-20 TaxID=2853806 RepID=UPI001C4962CD|nr:dehydratase [Shewanella sp. NIFS-20-20]
MPSLFSLYRKIMFGRKPGWNKEPLESIQVNCAQVAIKADAVERYASVCGFQFDGVSLPATYLHVLVFRLQAELFTHKSITFPLLGMIHLKNRIRQYRGLTINERVDMSCEMRESRISDAGLEFDLYAVAEVDGSIVWESVSTYLYRCPMAHASRSRPPKGSDINWQSPQQWHLDDDLGRRYALASGDYNLIHLHPILSKRFGFDRVLVHGMWSKARCLAALEPASIDRPFEVEVAFKLPLFMPADITFASESIADGHRFELRDIKGRRPHLIGQLNYL